MSTNNTNKILDDFKRRVKDNSVARFIRFAIVALIFIGWVAWLGSWWVLIFLILLFDIYITGYIPFTWWKKSKNPAVKTIMSWVDAIVYALILVYFVFTFFGQNYQIPSSSLEKTLLTGDYLWVNKMAYGPRVPMTPIHFPLVQNTFPIINCKSYLENPQWEYKRLKGYDSVKVGDIVVFNFPAGDTVATLMPNPDYYTLVKMVGSCDIIRNNPQQFGEVVYRPVDRRDNYVKRAVGLPGDTISIREGDIYINGEKQKAPEFVQYEHYVQFETTPSDATWESLDVPVDDRRLVNITPADHEGMRLTGFRVNPDGTVPPLYSLPLTAAMVEKATTTPGVLKVMRIQAPPGEILFPDGLSKDWTRAEYGPLPIPKKGQKMALNADTWPIVERIIRNYEGHPEAYLSNNGTVYINNQPASEYTFMMDYYFMMGDNRDNSLDSRYWGFVPEDHIVGKPIRILISFDKDHSLFNGGIRFDRIFKDANAGL